MRRGKRRRGHHAHGHLWDRPGDFTLDDPQRECTTCGLVATISKGGPGVVWILGLAEAAREEYRLPDCPGSKTMGQRIAALRRFQAAKSEAIRSLALNPSMPRGVPE